MRIIKVGKVHTFLVGIMMMVILLCCSSQVQAAQDGDYTYSIINGEAEITSYTGTGGVVAIPSTLSGVPVTSIGDQSFRYRTGITTIIIPQGVTFIGNQAFENCSGLTNINIPHGVTCINDYTFSNCTGLSTIILPQGITSIGSHAFLGCTSLTTINIPEGVTSILSCAYAGCTGLTSISIPQGVTRIWDGVFANCSGLSSISIPQAVTRIDPEAFACCTGLSSISIPKGVISIGDRVFRSCTGLTTITVAVDNLNYASIEGILFDKAGTILLACPAGLTSVSIPQRVTGIGEGAFYGCSGLTTIDIPQGVTSIDDEVFRYCRGLETIDIPQRVTSIGMMAFSDCRSLTTIRFNSSTTKISDESSTIPVTTTIIGYNPSSAKDYALKYDRKFEVIASKTLQSIAITTPATKLSYTVGNTLDISGLVVTGTYSDTSTKVESITTANVSGFNSSVATTDQVLTITVGGKTTTYKVRIVAVPILVTGVSLNKTITSINVGAYETLRATLAPVKATNKTVTWLSSNTAVATVDSNGKVVGVKAGRAIITVTTVDGSKMATCTVTVKSLPIVKVTKVSLNKKTISINVGDNELLIPTFSPTTATNQKVTWKSSKTSVATVDLNGKVTGLKSGTATITVTTVDGKRTATCKVTVKKAQIVKVTEIGLN